MAKQNEALLDFDGLFAKMEQARKDAGGAQPVILGGRFAHSRLSAFLDVWRKEWKAMPWRVWEYVSSIGFADEPEHLGWLQRADIFGEGGHLALRRDGERWLWHFIGPASSLPENIEGTKYPDTALHRYEESIVLWGEEVRKDKNDPKTGIGHWQDDRVGAAQLKYPEMKGVSRVYLHYWRYSQAGETQFVWYRGLGDENGVAKEDGSQEMQPSLISSIHKFLGRR